MSPFGTRFKGVSIQRHHGRLNKGFFLTFLQLILNSPVEEWPLVDALLSWHSDGFPLARAQDYVRLRRPFCVNDLLQEDLLLDRRSVYKTLQVGVA